jgi:osmoprotectant transport system ATP-binding protein
VVRTEDRLSDAGARMADEGARWAVVLDGAGALRGWIGVHEATGDGTVVDRARRMDAWVPKNASLKSAFGEMLQHDAGWIAVLDGDRFLGVLTPATLHSALRRSVGADIEGVDLRDVEVDTVARA